jgi:hypothetical protein
VAATASAGQVGHQRRAPIKPRDRSRVWPSVMSSARASAPGIHHLRHTNGFTLAQGGVHERVASTCSDMPNGRSTGKLYTNVSERVMGEAVPAMSHDAVDRIIGYTCGSRSGSRDRSEPHDAHDGDGAAGR